ncbi:MAG: N-acetylmuramic acid 6-phosphate etherase [Erysipelotrichaceae bacterium]|nr:N-acetylmuramic acid 6-phosphate etherase [Erysipelotrichaceae bacterium]
MVNLEVLETEKRNENSLKIDEGDFLSIIETINNEDKNVALAVEKEKLNIARLTEEAFNQLKKGGRIIYIGAGTSGRLGVLDASECPPTYGVDPTLVMGIIAGGQNAMFKAKEGAEDSEEFACEDLKNVNLSENDMVIGIAASGRTPYVIGGLKYANSVGASTGSIACVSNSKIGDVAKFKVEVITGGEVVQGSTRMKAGTAQKMVLNMISTTCMIKLGKVYGNLMVDVQPTNEKLVVRAKRIVKQALNVDDETSVKLFEASGGNVKVAIIMGLLKLSKDDAFKLLEKNDGIISKSVSDYNR